jgi:phosphonate transport system substrate-binding protein
MNAMRLQLILAVLLGLSGLLPLHPVPANAAETYNFSPVNQYGISLTAAYWNPIIDYVSEKSGVRLNLKIGRTSADTTAMLLGKEADFAFTNHLFSPDRQHLGWKVFGRRNTPPIHGALVVPAESPITQLSQLAGAEVGFPGPEATVSYKFTYAHLLSRGIDVKPVFGGNTDGILAQLFSGRVKAAGVNSQLMEGYARRENRPYRIMWQSEPVYDLPLMVSPRVPAHEARAVADAFHGMAKDPRGLEIIRNASILVKIPEDAWFLPATAKDYSAYFNFFRTAPAHLH